MGTPGGGASFFGGFAKGLGMSLIRKRQEKHAEELEQEAKEYKVLQDALHTASSRGDTPAIAHILRSMEEFSTGGGHKKGKERKKAQQGILSRFADALEGGKQTEESKQAGVQNQEMIAQGTPEQAERPRRALSQPLFQSNRQLAQEDIALEEEKQKRLLPLKTKEQEILIKSRAEEQRQLDAQKAREKQDLFNMQTQAKVSGDVEKLAYAYSKQYDISPEQAREMAGRSITELQEARTTELKARVKQRQDTYELHAKAFAESVRHHKELEKRAMEASARGDKHLQQRLSQSGSRELISSMGADLQQMTRVQSEINRLEGIVSNPLSSKDPNIQAYRNNLADLGKQYEDLRERVKAKQDKLDVISADLEEKRLRSTGGASGPPKKSLLKPGKESDPLGILP